MKLSIVRKNGVQVICDNINKILIKEDCIQVPQWFSIGAGVGSDEIRFEDVEKIVIDSEVIYQDMSKLIEEIHNIPLRIIAKGRLEDV